MASDGPLAEALATCWIGSEEDQPTRVEVLLLLLEARKPEPSAKWLDRWAALRARFEVTVRPDRFVKRLADYLASG